MSNNKVNKEAADFDIVKGAVELREEIKGLLAPGGEEPLKSDNATVFEGCFIRKFPGRPPMVYSAEGKYLGMLVEV